MRKSFLIGSGLIAAGLSGVIAFNASGLKKKIQLVATDKIGDVAAERLLNTPEAAGSVAAEFISIPIIAREIGAGIAGISGAETGSTVGPNAESNAPNTGSNAPNAGSDTRSIAGPETGSGTGLRIWQATGVGNTHLIRTPAGDILFDTGLATQVPKQMKALRAAAPDIDPRRIIISHAHADHSGGVKFWHEKDVEIIAHAEFPEEQRYLTELQAYFWFRNRILFPFMPERPPRIGLIAYGGVEPDRLIYKGQPYKFAQGGIDFELHALSGAEGADNLVLWLPAQKILFSGDFFGPLFPQFPNIFTMRGEKIRKPIEYITALDKIIALEPRMIIPSHKDPVTDRNLIREGLVKMRDATRYVHDATVAAMNAGQSLEEAMSEIALPDALALTQIHGKVSWAVKSIWEYYATWFHFDRTTDLYAVPQSTIYADIVTLAGAGALAARAERYNTEGSPLKALHLADIVLESESGHQGALKAREMALEALREKALATTQNSYEIYWLDYRLRETRGALQEQ